MNATASPTGAETAAGSQRGHRPYTAVIHFHGIGQQRHYESVAQLVEGLHGWVRKNYGAGESFFTKAGFKGLRKLKVRREPLRHKNGREEGPERVVYLQAQAPSWPGHKAAPRVRFYEAYWAPETVKGTNSASVAVWLLKQAGRPLRLLFTKWIRYDRIRTAELSAMYRERRQSDGAAPDLKAIQAIASHYGEFVDRRGSDGSYRAFRSSLGEALRPHADRWYARFRWKQVRHLATIVLLLAAAGAALGLVLLAVVWLLGKLAHLPWLLAWLPDMAEKIQPTWSNALALVPVVLGVLGVKRFLGDHVGDVQQLVSYEETEALYERRHRVLAASIRQLEHVLCDPACQRAVIVAHSLGTGVAYDALRDLAESNIAHHGEDPFKGPVPLDKIEYFITLGSPIDKINYFFVDLQSNYRIYEVLARTLHGDIASCPFSKVGRQPHIHWVNYWDRADLISGSLDSVVGYGLGRHDVDNVQVVNYVIPNPVRSHTDYYGNPQVLADIFWMAFYRHHSYVAPARKLFPEDIVAPEKLLAALGSPADPAARFVRGRLSPEVLAAADSAFPTTATEQTALLGRLVDDLNRLLHGPAIYDFQCFAGVKFREATRALLRRQDLDAYETAGLNRLLLEDAFREISRAPRRRWLGPGVQSRVQSILLSVQLVIPLALIVAFLETLLGWGAVGRWTLVLALIGFIGCSWLERGSRWVAWGVRG